ncbi:MAG TPA: sigma-70 family RNA polymerase sigma factor [Polyangiaceae bacterium]
MGATSRSPRLRLISSDALESPGGPGATPARDPHPASGVLPALDQRLEDGDEQAPDDEVELVGRARRSEAKAFELLYRRHAEFAFNLAVRIQGSATDVEDVVHDAFLRAQECLKDLRDETAFRPWLGSIVVRLVRTRLRRRRLLGALGLTTPEPVEIESIAAADADPEACALLAQVYALLQTLAADDRIAWTLRYVERHRLETVAVMMDCSLATAKRRIARAQRFLTAHFVAPFAHTAS